MMKRYLKGNYLMSLLFLSVLIGLPVHAAVQYSNDFNNPSSENVQEAWPEWVIFEGGTMQAVNGRIEWDTSGGNNDWIRLDEELPDAYNIEFDFYYQEGINGRFSVWPFAKPGESIFDRHNYFLRTNSHYFNGADTIPSEGERDMTLPLGANPHRLRVEVSGLHVALLYKDRGEGGWILVDERDFPEIDDPRYFQFGYNHDGGTAGLIYVDNFVLQTLPDIRAEVNRDIQVDSFEADTPVPVSLSVEPTGDIESLIITEGFPNGWTATSISNGGTIQDGEIVWNLENVSEAMTLSYETIPPRLIRNRVAGFSGSVGSNGEEDRIKGDTAIEIELPYLYREAIDYDFHGSMEDGIYYPTEYEYGERYAEGKDGIPSDVVYERPGDGETPEIGTTFDFPEDEDFHQGTPEMLDVHGESYAFEGYRDEGEVWLESGASDTGASISSIDAGDWFRYTFDLGEGDQVIIVNLSLNSWHSADNFPGVTEVLTDVYVDNEFKGEISVPVTAANEFNFFSVGPMEVSGGVHSIVVAFPGEAAPTDIGRLEVIRVTGIGQVSRTLTEDGFFDPTQPLEVTFDVSAEYGSYEAFFIEEIPAGAEVIEINGNGTVEGNEIIWELDPTETSTSVSYTIQPPEGTRFLLFNGAADIGLPLAEDVKGDISVVNELWLFGESTADQTDEFDGDSLSEPWFIEYGSDPAMDADYQEGVVIEVVDGVLQFNADTISQPGKFDEWANGRRAPMVLRTDIPEGDWRIETSYTLTDTFLWDQYHVGLVVAFNEGDDEDVSGDEYLLGFHSDDLRVELTNEGATGILEYHDYTDELNWLDAVWAGDVNATIAVTRRGEELIFSAQLPGRPWQLVGPPVRETRRATRIGLFNKIWGDQNFTMTEFDSFTLSDLEAFTDVSDWALY